MASAGGFKPSPHPPIADTGMKGFLKWLQREQPGVYRKIAPLIAQGAPEVFGDYDQSVSQQMRARAATLSLSRRFLPYAGPLAGLGQTSTADASGGAQDLSTQIQILSETDLTPVNVAAPDAVLGVSVPENIDTADAANTGAGTSTTTTDWISSLVNNASRFMMTQQQLNTQSQITQLQLQRAQGGREPLNIGLNANGIPTILPSGLSLSGNTLWLVGGLFAAFMLLGRRRAA